MSDVSNAATAFSNIKQAATDSATGVIEIATNAETVAFSDTSRAITADDLGYVLQKSYNHVNYAKGRLLDRILANGTGLYTTLSNIKGLWLFDQTEATSTITDRTGNGHDITLRDGSLNAINASTCSPGVTGLAPYIALNATHVFNIVDSDDFTCIEPEKMTVISLIYITSSSSIDIFCKSDSTTGATKKEYSFYLSTLKPVTLLRDNSANAFIGAWNSTTALSLNTLYTLGFTYDGGGAKEGIKIYANGSQFDNATLTSGTYVAMENMTSLPGSYDLDASSAVAQPFIGRFYFLAFIKEELTATQWTNWDRLLRSYAGIAL